MTIKFAIITTLLLAALPKVESRSKKPYSNYPKYFPCRPYVGFSRCVDDPLNVKDDSPWCPYHVCGVSFVRARKCGSPDKKATHYCTKKTVRVAAYECTTGKKHKWVRLPVGCRKKRGECTGRTRACGCEKRTVKRVIYTKVKRAIFKCRKYGKRHGGKE